MNLKDPFQYQSAWVRSSWVYLFVVDSNHASLMRLTMANSFFLDEIELVVSVLDSFSLSKFGFHQNSERRDFEFDRQHSFHPTDKEDWDSIRGNLN